MSKKMNDSAKQDRKGIAAVQQIVTDDLGWIFREQPTDDYGIDAQFELVQDNSATGRLLAVQIKSGPSYFTKHHEEGWWYSLRTDDLEYWMEHSLPVIVVLYDPTTKTAHWAAVNERTVVTGERGGKKILVTKDRELGERSRSALTEATEGKPYELHIRQLQLSLPWMRLLQNGRRILIEADEWINKTSGRGDIQIVSVDEANEDRVELGRWFIMVGSRPYAHALPSLFPWANAVLHKETYDEADYETWEAECVYYDREGDQIVSESYEDWMSGREQDDLRPYSNSAGEVDHWRLELTLNELGDAFLTVDKFAEGRGMVITPNPPQLQERN